MYKFIITILTVLCIILFLKMKTLKTELQNLQVGIRTEDVVGKDVLIVVYDRKEDAYNDYLKQKEAYEKVGLGGKVIWAVK